MFSQLLYRGPSIEVLHDRYAKQGRIDDQAPVTTSYEIHIDAPVQRVWELLTHIKSRFAVVNPGQEITWSGTLVRVHGGAPAPAVSHQRRRHTDTGARSRWPGPCSYCSTAAPNCTPPSGGG